ncbi:MAG: 50S ribosomal protein L12 [Candidatus Pacearchaeota archaeon]
MEYVYAALLLHKVGKEVSEDNVKGVVQATGAEIDDTANAKIKSLVSSLEGVDIAQELENASLAQAAPAAGSGDSSESQGEESKEEESKEEESGGEAAAEGLSALFG